MIILPLDPTLLTYLKKHRLEKKFLKQTVFFETNPFHPSLHTELLEPKTMRIWSFRIDRSYRALFIFHDSKTIEILSVTNHYE